VEEVGQSEKPHGQEVDPDEMTDRPVIIGQFGDMEKNKIKATHGGIVRCSYVIFQPKLKKIAGRIEVGPPPVFPTDRIVIDTEGRGSNL
jgi:hypothetical protein